MRAIQYLGVNTVKLTGVARPVPEPGHALVRVQAAGICQTDVHVRASSVEMIPAGTILGHEIAGTVAEINAPDSLLAVGGQVVVHPVWSCGVCRMCVAGRENACRNTAGRSSPAPTPGVSVNGGLAEYVSVPVSALVPADGLDPAFAAVLPDAGLVPFHSLNAVRDLLRPGSTAVVIGIGGLGQFAVQLIRELTGARIIAMDVRTESLDVVAGQVDRTLLSTDPDAAAKVLAATGGYGADFVLDLVGNSATLRLAGAIVAPYGAIRVPGLSDGVFEFETSQLQTTLPWGASLTRPYSGTHQELHDLVALAQAGRISANLVRYSFDDALSAIDDLEQGKVRGRAVVVLDS
ncbi:alcohol dehydrogenase catalytic domain-containing protein [Amycolatopsis sp.]|uniref:alcohol dehydrogenase catalytic domain-containing protein n=1 Tax=Amycolatopsis sp. TaxID=37632 RepID=UPI002CD654FF|nr:alcohol dehydrogenase catalytic domain-containing protein [Amycolatopsis sp.]HVV07930.1 alcohol dehydrogenase catalytic domain-containing protein [Amycolatopsis sp.]